MYQFDPKYSKRTVRFGSVRFGYYFLRLHGYAVTRLRGYTVTQLHSIFRFFGYAVPFLIFEGVAFFSYAISFFSGPRVIFQKTRF